jgi:Fe2+ transport system protein FeoA
MKTAPKRTLSTVPAGKTVRITGINTGRGASNRLISMGLLPRTNVTVINHDRTGPVIVSIKGSRIMIGRGMAHKITVE